MHQIWSSGFLEMFIWSSVNHPCIIALYASKLQSFDHKTKHLNIILLRHYWRYRVCTYSIAGDSQSEPSQTWRRAFAGTQEHRFGFFILQREWSTHENCYMKTTNTQKQLIWTHFSFLQIDGAQAKVDGVCVWGVQHRIQRPFIAALSLSVIALLVMQVTPQGPYVWILRGSNRRRK